MDGQGRPTSHDSNRSEESASSRPRSGRHMIRLGLNGTATPTSSQADIKLSELPSSPTSSARGLQLSGGVLSPSYSHELLSSPREIDMESHNHNNGHHNSSSNGIVIEDQNTYSTRTGFESGKEIGNGESVVLGITSNERNDYNAIAGEERRDRLLSELSEYVESIRSRTEADGITHTVDFPNNFDSVVELMNRADIAAGVDDMREGQEVKRVPWAKCVLMEGLEDAGPYARYKGMFTDERTDDERMAKELASVRKLDIELANAQQRARAAAKALRDALREDDDMSIGEDEGQALVDAEFEATRRGRRRPRSEDGRSYTTNGVRSANTVRDRRRSRDSNGPLSPPSSSRSDRDERGSNRSSRRVFMTQKFTTAATDASSVASGGSGSVRSDSRGPTSSRHSVKSTSGAPNFLAVNAEAAARPASTMTREQEELVTHLLEDDDGMDDSGRKTHDPTGIWAEISSYGPTEEEKERMRIIDTLLGELGSAVTTNLNSNQNAGDVTFRAEPVDVTRPGEIVLRQEREERLRKERSKKLDASLAALQRLRDQAPGTPSINQLLQRPVPREEQKPHPSLQDMLLNPELAATRPVESWEVRAVVREAKQCCVDRAPSEEIEKLLSELRPYMLLPAHVSSSIWDRPKSSSRGGKRSAETPNTSSKNKGPPQLGTINHFPEPGDDDTSEVPGTATEVKSGNRRTRRQKLKSSRSDHVSIPSELAALFRAPLTTSLTEAKTMAANVLDARKK